MRSMILKLRPWSTSAFLAAVLAVVAAAAIQELFALMGIKLYFTSFFPAILIVSLLAGAPAGIFATLLTIPIVWWAFMPPYFAFEPISVENYHRFAMFVLGSTLVISFANLYREALVLFRK